MKRLILSVALLASPLLAQVKEKVEVPYVAFPIKMGKGFDTVQGSCLMCHSFGYVLNQGKQSRAFWDKKINKMIHEFKAPIDEKSHKIILDYLSNYYGNGK